MNTINRHNYEELFLLYVDGELNAEDQLAVENFVQQNTDLAVELEMLMHTKLSPEEMKFTDKESLLRTEGHSINETNYEEYFLLYIDNELSAAKREEVEMYVLKHPKLQNEFTTLKEMVLEPETLSYGDKTGLYRNKKRRAIYLTPWRMAAAAIFIGVIAIGAWLMQRPHAAITVATKTSTQKSSEQPIAKINTVDTIQQQLQQQETVVAQQLVPKKENKISSETAAIKNKKEKIINVAETNNDNNQQQVAVQHTVIRHNNIEQEQKEPLADVHIHDVVDVPQNIEQKQNDIAALQAPIVTDQTNAGYKVYPVAYKEINTNDEDNSLHVGMLDLNKDKVKNLFKKAGRMFGNKSNDLANEDGKLQVANFEIDTKKQ